MLRSRAPRDLLAKALSDNNSDLFVSELDLSPLAFQEYVARLEALYLASGNTAYDGMKAWFNPTDPWFQEWLTTQLTNYISSIRGAVRNFVNWGQTNQIPNESILNAVVKPKGGVLGLTIPQTETAMNLTELLQTSDGIREVLKSFKLRDPKFDLLLRGAIAKGTGLSQAKAQLFLDSYRDRMMTFRAEQGAIGAATTASQMAFNAAIRQQPQSDVRRYWMNNEDKLVRNAHTAIPLTNSEGVGINEAFTSPLGPISYPGDPNANAANVLGCRCWIRVERR